MPPPPDETIRELIAGLFLEAGRIMEDETVDLALALPTTSPEIQERVARARQAGSDVAAITAAAEVLLRRSANSA